jgi:flagellar assembly factor FliW
MTSSATAADRQSDDPATDQVSTLELLAPLPGFPAHTRFALIPVDGSGLLYALRSEIDPAVRLLVAPPHPFFPDYAPEISDESATELGLTGPEDAALLVVVNPGADAATATANLRAPVVVNLRTRQAAQLVLADHSQPFRASLITRPTPVPQLPDDHGDKYGK